MPDSLLKQYSHQNQLRQSFCDYWAVCNILNRKQDLEQLLAWAKRKRLAAPYRFYQSLLIDEESRLWRYQLHSPMVVGFAQTTIVLKLLLCSTPKSRYAKGYATKYRTRS